MNALVEATQGVGSIRPRSEAPAETAGVAFTQDETGAMLLRIAVWEIIFGSGDAVVLGAQVRAMLDRGSRWTTHNQAAEMSASIVRRFCAAAKAEGVIVGG